MLIPWTQGGSHHRLWAFLSLARLLQLKVLLAVSEALLSHQRWLGVFASILEC